MVSGKLITIIQDHSSNLADQWFEKVRHSHSTPTYQTFDEKALVERVQNVYANLGKWLEEEPSQVEKYFTELGAERLREGFKLSEVLSALFIAKRILWEYVLSQGLLDTALDLYQTLDLVNRVRLFFDQAAYYIAVGYENVSEKRP